MASPNFDDEHFTVDPSAPFKGVVVCCTSIPPEYRKVIDEKVIDLGGIHKYDLTPEVTHLVVGKYDTPKYRHTARERPDIRAMDSTWIDAVSDLWKKDAPIDFLALEREHQLKPLETQGLVPPPEDGSKPGRQSLLICLTGFHQEARTEIAEKIVANGGRHTDDLMRSCTHLIVYKPEGKKYTAAKQWKVQTVTVEWLDQSIARGMILDETKFDPLLPPDQIGDGAWTKKDVRRKSLGKRSRSGTGEGETGTRKLRKTASMKLTSQRNSLFGDILQRADSREYSFAKEPEPEPESAAPERKDKTEPQPGATAIPQQEADIFSGCTFHISGFNAQRAGVLSAAIKGFDGLVASTLYEASNSSRPHRFLIVPQTSQPDTHPQVPDDNTHVITEFYIEKCMHYRQFFPPREEQTAFGRPFPLFPIPGFAEMSICTAAFTGIELNQVSRAVPQLGATFQTEFRKSTSVLVTYSLDATRADKIKAARAWKVPVVSADWLWECISTGYKVPFDDFLFPEADLRKKYRSQPTPPEPAKKATRPVQRTGFEASPGSPVSAPTTKQRASSRPDPTAFDNDKNNQTRKPKMGKQESNISADFATARTRPAPTTTEPPLTELSSASLNKSPSPPKSIAPQPSRTKSEPIPRQEDEPPQADAAQDTESQRRAAAKAAERHALTSRLTTLLDSTTTPSLQDHEEPKPRRRAIMGRAISNVSAGSSANRATSEQREDEEAEPPRTQIGYDDPEAQGHKAALMDRMMGGSGEVGASLKRSVSSGGIGVGVVGGKRSLRKR